MHQLVIIFGGWLLSTGLTFAYMQGTIHPYYTVALAPAIGALAGIGSVLLWRHRAVNAPVANAVLALTVVVTGVWGVELLHTDSAFHPSVKWVEVIAAVAAVLLLGATALWLRNRWRLLVAAGLVTAVAVAIPTTAWAVGTAATPHSGAIPTAVSGSGDAGFSAGSSGGRFGGGTGGFPGAGRTGSTGYAGAFGDAAAGTAPGGTTGTAPGGTAGAPGGVGGEAGAGGRAGGTGDRGTFGAGGAGAGGTTTSAALAKALEKTTTRWAATVSGSQTAAALELATGGKAVMAMGGFTGTDPTPTLAEFEQWVKEGDITYYIAGGGFGGGGNGFSSITSWVEAHYKSETIGGETVYLLLQPKA